MWGDSIGEGIIRLLLLIDSVIYDCVSKLFEIFIDLANASGDIFTDNIIASVADRIYVIVGVVALFIVTYSLLQAIINPDNLSKGNMSGSKLAMNLVVSIVLISLVPSIFSFAYKVQDTILNENIIGNLFLGTSNAEIEVVDQNTGEALYTVENSEIIKQYGNDLSWSVLNAFFYPADDTNASTLYTKWSPWGTYATASNYVSVGACGGAILLTAGAAIAAIPSGGLTATGLPWTASTALVACGVTLTSSTIANVGYNLTDEKLYWEEMEYDVLLGDFSVITAFSNKIESDDVIYTPIISTIAGILLLYMVFSFCLDLGLRAVKLAVYEMIAPIPILARILPNNKIFNNWVKITITTFLEVFIRMIILFLVIFLASNISELNIPGGLFVKMIIILGIVTFGRQAPKLISDIFGIDSGNMKLGIMEKLGAGGALAAGALIGGGITAGVKNFTNSWRNSNSKGFGRFASAASSAIGGMASGGFRSAKAAGFKAKSWGDMKSAATSGSSAAHSKSKDRRAYKASHGGSTAGSLAGHVQDTWSGIKNWAGAHGNILDIVQYEDDYLSSFDDYSSIYENGAYKAMDAQLNQLDARIAAEGDSAETYSGSGVTLSTARKQLEDQMRYRRLKAISDNPDSAAYAALNIAKQVQKDPNMATRAGVSSEFISISDDFVLRNNKVYHKDGKSEWKDYELHQLFEGKQVTGVDAKGNVTKDVDSSLKGTTFKGLGSTKKKVRTNRNTDKTSIDYKEAKKAADKSNKSGS